MTKSKKSLLGFIGLIAVAVMTIVAYFIPTESAAAMDSVTDTLRVIVYDKFPAVNITSIDSGDAVTNPKVPVDFFYENIDSIDFTLSYVDAEGNTVEIPIYHFEPDDLDPEFGYASGESSFTFDLGDYDLGYDDYIITATPHSPIGTSEDIVDFVYVPATATQIGSEEDTQDPILRVDYGETVTSIEIMPFDKGGNPLFEEPIVITVPAPYQGGSETIVLPFGSYGYPSGEDYYVELTTYRYVPKLDENGDPILDAAGNPITELAVITAPSLKHKVVYTKPLAPDVPDTGRLLESLNTTKADYLITITLMTIIMVAVALTIISKTKHKKDYRKNLRRRK